MPCLLKARAGASPGVITFTHNEVLRGAIAQSQEVRDHLARTVADGEWLYGVHIQGDVSSAGVWPLEDWQAFVMWPDTGASFLQGLPEDRVLPINCANLLPEPAPQGGARTWDLCVLTRPSWIKRPVSSLHIIKHLLEARPDAEFVVVAHDPRDVTLGRRLYERQEIDQEFFELPQKLFSARELARISFIASSTQAFGVFPLTTSFVSEILGRSRMLLLTSHSEGTPRVLSEALLAGTPCAVSRQLTSGLNVFLDDRNSVRVSDEPAEAAREMAAALDDPRRFAIDRDETRRLFSAAHNAPLLRERVSAMIERAGRPVEGEWSLEQLHLRLAGHGEKINYQLMRGGDQFFAWLDAVQADPYDEDALVRALGVRDPYARSTGSWRERLAARLRR
jgi:hypothetical protein